MSESTLAILAALGVVVSMWALACSALASLLLALLSRSASTVRGDVIGGVLYLGVLTILAGSFIAATYLVRQLGARPMLDDSDGELVSEGEVQGVSLAS